MGDVRPHGSGRARPVLMRGYAPDGRVHSLCTLRIPVRCVRGGAVQSDERRLTDEKKSPEGSEISWIWDQPEGA